MLTSLLSPLELNDYVAFDLETTGLNPQKDYITEIAACRFVDGEMQDQYTTLINPGIPIPINIVEITGITDYMVKDAPTIEEVLPELMEFIGHSPLVGHNIDFDYTFLNNNCCINDILFPDLEMYDTLSLARTFIYFHNSFSLTSLCDYYNVSIENAHRASSDAMATGMIFKHLVQEAVSRPLTLIQQIVTLLKNSSHIYNHNLFLNILKIAVSSNNINGLLDPVSDYKSPKNIYSSDSMPKGNKFPDSPIEWFIDGGLIKKNWTDYENRSSQLDFIQDIYAALSEGHILMAEAGTGLGKSLAYLSVGLIEARENKRSIVVSTHTKNLQEQLFEKDIPQLSQALNVNINAVIYKGRYNYICRTRLQNLINNHAHLLKTHEYEALLTLLVWEGETQTGDINECNGFLIKKFNRLWSMVRSERGFCSTNRCLKYNSCYLGHLRNKVKGADIIIVNHALFANELNRDNTCLPDDFTYIIDEAHHFADVIRSQLVKEFGVHTFDDVFQYFHHDKKDWKVSIFNKHSKVNEIYEQLKQLSDEIKQQLINFFDSYYDSRSTKTGKSEYYVDKHLYRNSQEEFIDTDPNPWDILVLLQSFQNTIDKFSVLIMEYKEQLPKSILIEFEMVENYIKDGIDCFKAVLETDTDTVQWSSFFKRAFQPYTVLNSAPLKVNQFIHDQLLECYHSGIFCSATLTVNEDFTYFSEKTGLNKASLSRHVEEKVYQSPFHYSDQVKLFVYNHTIDVKDPAYIGEIAKQIDKISLSLDRRMLVLCTAYKQTADLKHILEPIIKNDNRRLFVQGPGISRNLLVRQYLEYHHSILIGTSSFWEGVDFPGDKVEILCIVKTPFDNPFDPLIQSQIEDYTQNGENAFLQYQVPEAAMKLRQGFGRLIRNTTDTGICVLMDTRLYSRQYGKTILDSLPVEAIPYQHVGKLISDSQKFF